MKSSEACKLLQITKPTLYKYKSNGTIINADVNAGYNILKKAFPNFINDDGLQGLVLNPQVVKIS